MWFDVVVQVEQRAFCEKLLDISKSNEVICCAIVLEYLFQQISLVMLEVILHLLRNNHKFILGKGVLIYTSYLFTIAVLHGRRPPFPKIPFQINFFTLRLGSFFQIAIILILGVRRELLMGTLYILLCTAPFSLILQSSLIDEFLVHFHLILKFLFSLMQPIQMLLLIVPHL